MKERKFKKFTVKEVFEAYCGGTWCGEAEENYIETVIRLKDDENNIEEDFMAGCHVEEMLKYENYSEERRKEILTNFYKDCEVVEDFKKEYEDVEKFVEIFKNWENLGWLNSYCKKLGEKMERYNPYSDYCFLDWAIENIRGFYPDCIAMEFDVVKKSIEITTDEINKYIEKNELSDNCYLVMV